MESPQTGAFPTQPAADFAEAHTRAIGEQSSRATTPQFTLIRLGEYQEISGKLVALDEDKEAVRIVLSVGTLEYPIGSREAEICVKELSGQIGHRVSIIRTPSTTDPLRIQLPGLGE